MRNNTTGIPDTENYNLGRGGVYFALLNASGLPMGFRHLGNVPEFKSTMTVEELKHQSSMQGLKKTDKTVTITQDMGISFRFEEFDAKNLALYFAGEVVTYTNAAIAGFTEHAMVPDGELEKGMHYLVKNASGQRAMDIDAADLTVKTNAGSPVTLVLGTDYTVDTTIGRIFILSTSTAAATAITAGDGLLVTLAAKAEASTVFEIRTLTASAIEGALMFISENPADDDRQGEFEWHKVALRADGDFNLISDDWGSGTFTCTCSENDNPLYADSPVLTIRGLNN